RHGERAAERAAARVGADGDRDVGVVRGDDVVELVQHLDLDRRGDGQAGGRGARLHQEAQVRGGRADDQGQGGPGQLRGDREAVRVVDDVDGRREGPNDVAEQRHAAGDAGGVQPGQVHRQRGRAAQGERAGGAEV